MPETRWQPLDRITRQRKQLLDAGYIPIATNGKMPAALAWQDTDPTARDIDEWARQFPAATNTGLLTKLTPTVDIDVLDARVVEALVMALYFVTGGRSIVRIGTSTKMCDSVSDRPTIRKNIDPDFCLLG